MKETTAFSCFTRRCSSRQKKINVSSSIQQYFCAKYCSLWSMYCIRWMPSPGWREERDSVSLFSNSTYDSTSTYLVAKFVQFSAIKYLASLQIGENFKFKQKYVWESNSHAIVSDCGTSDIIGCLNLRHTSVILLLLWYKLNEKKFE